MSKENSKKQVEQQLVTNVITAMKDTDGLFKIPTSDSLMLLSQFLGDIIMNRGEFRPLGMAFNPLAGANHMELTIYIALPATSPMGIAMSGGNPSEQRESQPTKKDS
jgi:hypothetical protein